MFSSSVDQLKQLNVTDLEITQLSKLKRVGASDDLCIALLKAARDHHHEFSNADSAIQLSQAGYSDDQILEMARSDQIDILSGEAITLKLIGLSNPTVQTIIHRRIEGIAHVDQRADRPPEEHQHVRKTDSGSGESRLLK